MGVILKVVGSYKKGILFSGDITDAPKGASEFIDINRKSFIDCKGRYLVMNVYSYTGQKFSEIPECFAGCMIRQKPKSGEIYEPKTVKDKFDLSVEATTSVPLIFDLVENEIIWCDMAIGGAQRYDMIETKQTGIVAVGKALTNLPKPNLYELFTLHAQARGKIVKSKKQADVVFSIDEGITPFDIEEITSKYL